MFQGPMNLPTFLLDGRLSRTLLHYGFVLTLPFQGSTLRLSNTRTSHSPSGMLVDRTRSVLYGATTSRTRRALYSSLTPTIESVSARQGRNYREC